MSLKIRVTISSTDLPEYESVEFCTREAEFDIEDILKAHDGYEWHITVEEKAGFTLDNRLAFLNSVRIVPEMIFGKPQKPLKEPKL